MNIDKGKEASQYRGMSCEGIMISAGKHEIPCTNDDDQCFPPERFLRVDKSDCILKRDILQWRPHKDQLNGPKDLRFYKNDIMFVLQAIGYIKGIQLTNLDKANFGSMIRRSACDKPRSLIEDLSSGMDMMRLLNTTYRLSGVILAEQYFNSLLDLKFNGEDAITFVTSFRAHIRDLKSTGQEMPYSIIMMILKRAVEKMAHRWHYESYTSESKP